MLQHSYNFGVTLRDQYKGVNLVTKIIKFNKPEALLVGELLPQIDQTPPSGVEWIADLLQLDLWNPFTGG